MLQTTLTPAAGCRCSPQPYSMHTTAYICIIVAAGFVKGTGTCSTLLLPTRVRQQMVHKQAGMKTYDEVNAAVSLLGYPTINAGCCKVHCCALNILRLVLQLTQLSLQVMVHPTFGTKVCAASGTCSCVHPAVAQG